jgi:hypothetical protein
MVKLRKEPLKVRYEIRAEDCDERAAVAQTDEERAAWEIAASAWRDMAENAPAMKGPASGTL